MNKAQIESELEKLWEDYYAKIRTLAKKVKQEHVDSFCKTNNLQFAAGNADWIIFPQDVTSREAVDFNSTFQNDEPTIEGQAELIAMLEVEVQGFNTETIGCLMFDL